MIQDFLDIRTTFLTKIMDNWKNYLNSTCKIFATISTKDSEKSIYRCLKSAQHQFDAIFLVDHASKDKTSYEVYKFLKREKPNNVFVFDFSHKKHWPDLPSTDILENSKRRLNEYSILPQTKYPYIWVSIPSNVILSNNSRNIIYDDISKWKQPEINFSFYKTSLKNWNVSASLKQGHLFPGPDSCDHKNPCFYIKNQNSFFKTSFDANSHSAEIIGEEI